MPQSAAASAALGLPHPGTILAVAGYLGLLFLTHQRSDSAWGLAAVFDLAGFMGCILATASLFVSIFNLFGRLLPLLGLLGGFKCEAQRPWG
ncbi:hypothetical protein THIX_80003 [Thiomonas sp. X19]|uniref:hypothetical protein n=1 Tax=Thiomonas sp. X19 TaxID=1050370 RepID=UPI000B74BC56|nr:hypothetical protein [Thiomonas sp. X19]SCC95217.1 hypothetical protein THIX_80003 [Thiomonas sp. X19]